MKHFNSIQGNAAEKTGLLLAEFYFSPLPNEAICISLCRFKLPWTWTRYLQCWHILCPADLNCKKQRPAGRQLQERPLTTAEKYVRAHLTQPEVCGCLVSLYRSSLSLSKQQWNPTGAVLSFQRMPTIFPLVAASELFGSQTPSSQPDPQVKLTSTAFYTTLWMWGGIACISSIKESQQLCHATAAKPGTFKFHTSKLCQMLPTPNATTKKKSPCKYKEWKSSLWKHKCCQKDTICENTLSQ